MNTCSLLKSLAFCSISIWWYSDHRGHQCSVKQRVLHFISFCHLPLPWRMWAASMAASEALHRSRPWYRSLLICRNTRYLQRRREQNMIVKERYILRKQPPSPPKKTPDKHLLNSSGWWFWEENEDRRALEAKAATDTAFLKASNPVSQNQAALRVVPSLTMKDFYYCLQREQQ